jgi:alkaline phosphatase D
MKKALILSLSSLFFIVQLSGQTHLLPNRSDLNPLAAPFFHGIASGDPTANSVILWTRITGAEETAEVLWEIATDTTFSTIVSNGNVSATAQNDYTVKVIATNLSENSWYYYRFLTNGIYSPMGRTRTAPAGGIENLRFAVMSCSNYQDGFFNAYRDVATKNDVDAIIHLGDYIYEYGISDFSPGTDTSRLHQPENEVVSLEEYRIRQSHYKLDPDLQEIHRQFPFIVIWDDHETANNSWVGGAQNHTEGVEGEWEARKNNGKQAFFEWMPVSEDNGLLRRNFSWGNLVELIMLDTRLEGRDVQAGTSGSAVTDTNRTLLGAPQLEWFKSNLSSSQAQWKLIGNQVMIAPLRIFGNPVNEDQWDGYPAERERVLKHIDDNNINNCVFLTGDIHTSWGNDVPRNINNYTASTGAGSVAVEYVCTSVTSSSFLTFGVPVQLIQVFNPTVKYADLTKRGYLLLDVNQQNVQGDWVHMNTISSRTFQSSVSASWRCLNNENHLVTAPQALQPRGTNPVLAPNPDYSTVSLSNLEDSPLILSCMPNPFIDKVGFQFYLTQATSKATISLLTLTGETVFTKEISNAHQGLHEGILSLEQIASGVYVISVNDGKSVTSRKIIKQ